MKTAIIFEINDMQAVVLKPNGQFMTVPAEEGWQKGDVVHFTERSAIRAFASQISFHKKQLSALTACIALAIIVGLGGRLYFHPVALVSMDVNPAVELQLNRFDKVVSMHGLNESGEDIVMHNKLVYQDYIQAVDALLQEDTGFAPYLQENPAVVFTVYAKDADKEALLTARLEDAAQNLTVQEGAHIAVECHAVDATTLENAHRYGVTAGKYLYLQQLTEADPSLHMEDYTHHTIKQLKEQIDNCQANHSQNAESGSAHHGHQ